MMNNSLSSLFLRVKLFELFTMAFLKVSYYYTFLFLLIIIQLINLYSVHLLSMFLKLNWMGHYSLLFLN